MRKMEISKDLEEQILKSVKEVFGSSPPCFFCGKESVEVVMRLVKPSDIIDSGAFVKMVLERNRLPQSFGEQPALYVCGNDECNSKAKELLHSKGVL